MKKIILLALVALASVANASKADEEYCGGIYDRAKVIMDYRQKGTPIKIIYDVTNKMKAPEEVKEVFKHMINDAYEKPQFQTEKYRKEAAEEFANYYFLQCIKSFED